MKTIDETTKLPIKLLITLVSIIVGLAIWGTRLEAKIDSHETSDDKRVELIEQRMEVIQSIDRRLSRIEGKLNIK